MRMCFDDFLLDLGTRQLLFRGQARHVSPKAFELLRLLVSSRPNAISKSDLQAHLWPNVFVSEANLPMLVGELRTVLGDDPQSARFIRTVPRFGYAFSAPTSVVPAGG